MICDRCGGQVVPLVFGMPTESLARRAQRGEVALGGCCCWGDERDPTHECAACGRSFGGLREAKNDPEADEAGRGPAQAAPINERADVASRFVWEEGDVTIIRKGGGA